LETTSTSASSTATVFFFFLCVCVCVCLLHVVFMEFGKRWKIENTNADQGERCPGPAQDQHSERRQSAFRLVHRSPSLPASSNRNTSPPASRSLAPTRSLFTPGSPPTLDPSMIHTLQFVKQAVERSILHQALKNNQSNKAVEHSSSSMQQQQQQQQQRILSSPFETDRPAGSSCSDASYEGSSVLCQVCGDRASGFHYGVHACEGCKGFFRRSIQQKIQYRPCSKNQQCSVLRINRNRCQYCRLKKCIAVGMSRDAVRFGRVPKKEKAKLLAEIQRANTNNQLANLMSTMEDAEKVVSTLVASYIETDSYFKSCSQLLIENFREHRFNMRISLTACPLHPEDVMMGNVAYTDEMSENYLPAIRSVITFAKNIPGFSILLEEDQIILLKAGVFEALLLRLAPLFDTTTKSLMLLNGSIYQRGASIQGGAGPSRFLVDSLFDFIERFNALELTDVEMALFSAVVLISSGRPGLKNPELVGKCSQRLRQLLEQVIYMQHGNDVRFFNTLMQNIPNLRTLNTLHAEKLLDADSRLEKRCPMDLPGKVKPCSVATQEAVSSSTGSSSISSSSSSGGGTGATIDDGGVEHGSRCEMVSEALSSCSVRPPQQWLDLTTKKGRRDSSSSGEQQPSTNLRLLGSSGAGAGVAAAGAEPSQLTVVKLHVHSPTFPSKDNISFDSGKGSLSAKESFSSNESLSEQSMNEYKSTGTVLHKPLTLSNSSMTGTSPSAPVSSQTIVTTNRESSSDDEPLNLSKKASPAAGRLAGSVLCGVKRQSDSTLTSAL
ncbi:Nuclear hormone receptor E75, partial [Trichinella pseudospiralis]